MQILDCNVQTWNFPLVWIKYIPTRYSFEWNVLELSNHWHEILTAVIYFLCTVYKGAVKLWQGCEWCDSRENKIEKPFTFYTPVFTSTLRARDARGWEGAYYAEHITTYSPPPQIFSTDKRTDVWSRDFIVWKINSGLWAVVWAGLWNKWVWANYEQLLRPVFSFLDFFEM